MVYYPVLKYITKTALSQARDFAFSDANKQEGQVAVPNELNGRLNRLYQLRDRYLAAIAAAPAGAVARRADANIQRIGLKFARCQKQFNLELYNRRRIAAHSGTPMGMATQVPTTSPQYLGLILVEQRRIAAALEGLAGLVPLLEIIAANYVAASAVGDNNDGSNNDDE
ncbi:hypothetical protein DPSP01_014123 [Paraphaeosphaeria sporulosa]